MDDNIGDDSVMGLDLNEPLVDPPPPPVRSFSGAPETLPTAYEDRVRRYLNEADAMRSRNDPELSYVSATDPIVEGERGTNCKRDITQLTKALGTGLDSKKNDNDGANDRDVDNGNFFDCNICLDVARDPILTCCGHLFCWGCFYQVPYVDTIARECPVCKGEVIDVNITPIYGHGRNSQVSELESGVQIPPRPRARRIESLRQQNSGQGFNHIPVADALRRIRISLGLIEENPSNRPVDASRPITESESSLFSISSALSSAERFIEDLEAYINDRRLRRNVQIRTDFQQSGALVANVSDNPDPQTGEMNPAVPSVLHFGGLEADATVEIDLTITHPGSSSRRRRGVTRSASLEREASLEQRRRRLR